MSTRRTRDPRRFWLLAGSALTGTVAVVGIAAELSTVDQPRPATVILFAVAEVASAACAPSRNDVSVTGAVSAAPGVTPVDSAVWIANTSRALSR